MQHKDIQNSSSIKRIGYDPQDKVLEITFLNGFVYEYKDVLEDKWEEALRVLEAKESIGKWCARNIKTVYKHKLIA